MKPLSILAQVTALALATLLLAFALCFAVVIATPAPKPLRMTIGDAVAALQGKPGRNFTLDSGVAPPSGPGIPQVETAIAEALGVNPSRVHARWLGVASMARQVGQSVVLVGNRALLVDSDDEGLRMRWSGNETFAADTEMPPFMAWYQGANGAWQSVSPVDLRLAAWRLRMLIALGLALVLLAFPTWYAARRLTRPIQRLATAAAGSALHTSHPFPVEGPREVREVGAAINAMHTRLADEADERLKIFAAIAHDLRTPLTGLRIRAEFMPPTERQRVIEDIDRMADMTAELLDYARFNHRPLHRECIDLTAFLADVAEGRRSVAQNVEFHAGSDETLVLAESAALRRAIDNLIDNALRFAGDAKLSIEHRPGYVDIHVDDNGPGIPEALLQEVLKPFSRLEGSRSRETGGAGLGLAIVTRIAASHGGAFALSHRAQGGLRATLSLVME